MVLVYDTYRGRGIVVLIYRNENDLYELWEASLFGGEQQYREIYLTLEQAINVAKALT